MTWQQILTLFPCVPGNWLGWSSSFGEILQESKVWSWHWTPKVSQLKLCCHFSVSFNNLKWPFLVVYYARPNDFHDFAEYFVLEVMQGGRMCINLCLMDVMEICCAYSFFLAKDKMHIFYKIGFGITLGSRLIFMIRCICKWLQMNFM